MTTGIVYLVGSGPGRLDLLTIRAAELIGQADVVVFDKLANYAFFPLLAPGAQLVDVGKQADQHTMPQEQINQLLVELAQSGKTVVRLKGGDPYVFGRGGEEAEVLVAHSIPFEVVPGVSSSIAVPGSAGIPVTHRDHCTSFHVITGHERADRDASVLDFRTLAALSGTLVFLMGVRNLATIASELIAHGKDASTPVAVISRGCTPRQRQVCSTLESIARLVQEQGIMAPAVTVVGSVVDLQPILSQTRLQRPLSQRRVLVTRTRKQASRLSTKLREQGADTLELPLIRVEPSSDLSMWENLLQELPGMDWLVLTSENGVDFLLEHMRQVRMDIRDLIGVKVAAVGSATADRLLANGVVAQLVPPSFTVESLTDALLPIVQAGERVALARAEVSDPQIAVRLRDKGVEVLEAPIYRTLSEGAYRPYLRELLQQGELDWLTFASSSTVESFMELLDGDVGLLARTRVASIGPVTTRTLERFGITVHAQAQVFTLDGMVQAMLAWESQHAGTP